MKQCVILFAGLSFATPLVAQLSKEQVKKAEAKILEEVRVEAESEAIDSAAAVKVFATPFLSTKVKLVLPGDAGSMHGGARIYAVKGDEVLELESTSTNMDLPVLRSVLDPKFRIATAADAEMFEKALDALYPISDSFGGRDLEAKKIVRKDGQWIFVRGEFFKKLKGFVVAVDATGKITDLDYSLKIEPE